MRQVDPSPPASTIAPVRPADLPSPNLGPVPINDPPEWPGPAREAGLAILVVAAIVMAWFGRAWRRRAARKPAVGDVAGPLSFASDPTDAGRLIASSREVRDALVAAFGPSMGSKTTEEIADDPSVVARLPADLAARIVSYLAEVDRAKFDAEGRRPADSPGLREAIEAAGQIVDGLRAAKKPA